MADVTLSYKGSDILELSNSGSATLKTGGKYCEDDIGVEYVKPSGGGGVDVFTGTIELSDTTVGNNPTLTIPVDVRNYNNFRAILIATQTGVVSGGIVTLYDTLEIPSAFDTNSRRFIPKYWINYPEPPLSIKRDDTNISSVTNFGNCQYLHANYGFNLTAIAAIRDDIVTANGIVFSSVNGTRFFCVDGAYVKFSYRVEAW